MESEKERKKDMENEIKEQTKGNFINRTTQRIGVFGEPHPVTGTFMDKATAETFCSEIVGKLAPLTPSDPCAGTTVLRAWLVFYRDSKSKGVIMAELEFPLQDIIAEELEATHRAARHYIGSLYRLIQHIDLNAEGGQAKVQRILDMIKQVQKMHKELETPTALPQDKPIDMAKLAEDWEKR